MPEQPRRTRQRRRRIAAATALVAVATWRALLGKRIYTWPRPVPAGHRQEHANPVTAYEHSDWPIGPVAVVYAGIVALLVICCFVLIAASPTSLPDVDRNLRIEPPGPRLQTTASGDLARFRADEQRRLDTYYWVDRQKETVHIPIGEAMKKLVETGIPDFPRAGQ